MKLKNIHKKFGFIFTMLVTVLTLFCINAPIKAEETNNMQNLNITNRLYFKADGYEQSNKPDNIVDGSMQNGNGKNWYGGTKFLLEYTNLSTIYSIGVYTTENWGTSFRETTIYYSEDDSLTLDSDLSNFKSVKVSTESVQTLVEPIKARRIMLVKDFGNAVYEFECFGTYTTSISTEGIKFKYTGDYQEFIVPKDGQYKIELWGASGSTHQTLAGKGAYTSGTINLKANQKLYFYVGQSLDSSTATFNGGGACGGSCSAGGGATDVRLLNGNWNDESSLASRIMVAGGGGGYNNNSTGYIGGYAGGLIGGQGAGDSKPTGGTQTSGGLSYANVVTKNGKFGIGGTGESWGGGAGGGYYGGGAGANSTTGNAGAGGSSYISGYLGSVAITSETDVTPKEGCSDGTDDIKCSYHYSNMIFSNTIMKSGHEEMPTYNASNTMIGHIGNGLAKITLVDLSKNNYLSELTTNRGTLSPSFDPSKDEYTLTLSKYDSNFTLSGTLSDDKASVTGLGEYTIELGKTKTIEVMVTAASGDIRTYTINATRETLKDGEHSSKLLKLEVEGYEDGLNPEFHPLTNEYNVEISNYEIDLNVITETYDPKATVEIIGNKYIKAETGVVTIKVSSPGESDTVYRINYNKADFKQEYVFDYTGDYQEFITPISGQYKIELWGAAGGGNTTTGFGGYTSGKIKLNKNQKLYVYVGNRPERTEDSFNGGGQTNNTYYPSDDGGGATDIRLEKGNMWSDFNSLKSRIMVAGGGGGYVGYGSKQGCSAGGLLGYDCGGTGGTQTSPGKGHTAYGGKDGKFGIGGNAELQYGGGAGGSGYYGGGGGGNGTGVTSGAGGSSFISGHEGCDAIDKVSTEDNIVHTGQSIHYSNLLFEDTVMIDGEGYNWTTEKGEYVGQPTFNGSSIQTGNNGNGYAKITSLSIGNIPTSSEDNYLTNITSDYGTLSPNFVPLNQEYILKLDKYDMHFTLDATLSDESASVIGLGKYTIESGETKTVEIIVTAASGDIRTYTINATRESLAEGEHSSKLSKLEVEGYEDDLNPEFHPLTNQYNIELSNTEIDLNIMTETFDEEATVKIEGNRYIKSDTGLVTITVSVPGESDTIYKINYNKKKVNSKNGIISWVMNNDLPNGDYDVIVNGKTNDNIAETITYRVELINYYDDVIYTTENADEDGYIQLGDDTDEYKMLIVKYHKNLTIEEGVTLIANTHLTNVDSRDYELTYKKGMYIHTAGALTNNGTISMTARGTYNQAGENVYLYENSDGSFDYVPAVGGLGGTGSTSDGDKGVNGSYGKDGNNRQTGGGGAGANTYSTYRNTTIGGAGSAGTSYSGGAGGGSSNHGWHAFSNAIGTMGGNCYGVNDGNICQTGVGATTGTVEGYGDVQTNLGTGGLLIIYSNSLNNNGTIESKGIDPASTNKQGYQTYGGASGGGSINIFSNSIKKGTITAAGGIGREGYTSSSGRKATSGNGGNGSISSFISGESRDNYLSELVIDHGTLSPSFDPLINEYTLTLSKYDQNFTLSGTLSDENATVTGLGEYKVKFGEVKTIEIVVTAASGDIKTYTVNATRETLKPGEHSSKLSKLEVVGYENELTPEFHPLTNEYSVDIYSNEVDINLVMAAFDDEASIKVEGNRYIKGDTGIVTITVSAPGVEDTIYKINYTRLDVSDDYKQKYDYEYTGDYQTFVAPMKGKYTIELWGAQGGGGTQSKGAYTKGDIKLDKGQILYVYVGKGNSGGTSFNGGAGTAGGSAGGGATDIRLEKGDTWRDFNSLKSRIMVAAGSGSGDNEMNFGFGGALEGGSGKNNTGGTQIAAGGPNNYETSGFGYADGGCTGGGGYYGGGSAACYDGAGGGSSFISGYDGADAIDESSTEDNIIHTGQSIHYSGLSFINPVMIAGNKEMPTHDGTGTMTGNEGDGYAKITPPLLLSKDNYLSQLVVDKGILSPEFDPIVNEYNVELGIDDTEIRISARPSSDLAVIEGLGKYKVPGGTTTYPIMVTAESGDIQVYNINITRPSSSESKPNDIKITGLVPSVCDGYSGYCSLDKEFDSNINEYHMTVPAGIRDLEFTVEKSHDYQTVTGNGVIKLARDENVIRIEVTSEDGANTSTYTYHVTRDMTGDNYIDRLELLNPSIDIGFHYLITEYAFRVENNITSLDMNVVLDDENASYEVIGNSDFKVGNNIVEIRVTALNGEERSYILNVYRVSNGNALLNSLTVTSGNNEYTLSPEFKDITTSYTLTVPNDITSININATVQETTTNVLGTGTKTLKTGLNMFDITTSAEDGTIETYQIIITREKSDNNYLSNITVGEGTLSPAFNENTNSYEISVNPHTKRLTLGVTLKDNTAKYEIIDNSNFKIGENLVTIKVTAEDGSIRNYYIVVTKEGSDNNYLSSLNITNASINFNKETLEYNVTVENNVKNILISGSKEDTLSAVTGFGNYNLTSGDNSIKVRVTSETGKIRDYIINVFRKYNADASLREIRLSNGSLSPEFSSNVFEYSVNVGNEQDKIVIDGIANENTTTVEGNGSYPLIVGRNEITLRTTSEDNTTESYKIVVIRDKSSNANLSFLSLKEGLLSPEFDKMTVNYTALVPNDVTSVNVVYTKENSLSNVTVTGDTNLVLGENTINVIVTAEDGNVKTYEIKITRQEVTEDNLNLRTLDLTSCTLSPEFSGDNVYYECIVPNEITSTTVNASAVSEDNTIVGIGEKNLKVGQNTVGVKVKNKDNIEKDYQVTVTREANKDSRLNNIIVENHTLNETFNKDILEYSLVTQNNSLNINAVKLYDNQTIEIIGNSNFKVGLNTVMIKVTAEDKNYTSTYTLNVLRERSDNNYLSNLYVEGHSLTPSFNKGMAEYNLTVENEVNSIIVNGSKENTGSTVKGFGMYTLQKGLNEIKIVVTSESGIEREYKITVTRLGSKNNYLSDLSVKDHTLSPEFNKNTNEYNLEINYNESEIEVIANSEDENATITGNGIVSLSKNQEKHSVVVTSENGGINTYYINLIRRDAVTSKLANIEIPDYYLDEEFDSEKTDYTVRVDNEIKELNLIITKLDPNSTYIVEGNENFEVGLNEVKIKSTSSDGEEETTYTLTVYRQEYANTYLSALSVNKGNMKPSFNKTNLTYNVTVPYNAESIVISASPENVANTVSGTGEKILKDKDNLFKVTVTTKGGIVRTYSVIVKKEGSNNANIRNITSNVGELTKLNEYDYELVVPKTVKEITKDNFTVTLEDEKASITMGDTLDLTSDSKIYKITVISADGSKVNEYMIHVKYLLSSDSRIRELTPSSGTLREEFSSDVYRYTLDVFDYVSEVEFETILNDENARLLNNSLVFELKDYTTQVELTVQAEDGTTSIYTINVEKSLTIEKYLQDIDVTLVEGVCDDCVLPEYNETTYDYEIILPYDVDKIDFVITKKHQNQVVKIYKNDIEILDSSEEKQKYLLEVGLNNYKIEVINSLGEITNYNYVIERLKSNTNYLKSLKLISPEYQIENFDKENLEYSVQIPYEYENIVVEAVPEDTKNATVKIEGYTYLLEGNNDVKITVTSGTKEKREYIIHVLRTPESNNLIKTLTVSSGDIYELTPKFAPGINDYTLTVPSIISKITIEAIPDLETTKITGEGEYDLKTGVNKFILESTSLEGQVRTYVITITRESSKNVYLKNLVINNGTLKEVFKKERTSYNVEVGYNVESLDMLIEKEDEESLVEVVGNENLLPGENIVKIRVRSKDLSVAKTYVLNVLKDKSPNNDLLSILVDEKQIEGFSKDKTEYNITVENDKTSVDIKALADNIYATVSGNGVYSLSEGVNKITITVMAANGSIKDYIINVTRKNNTYLSKIETNRGNLNPKFDKNTQEYTVNVDENVEDITIASVVEDASATVTGNKKYQLKSGNNEIILTVTNGEDTREYKINVIRKISDNCDLKYLTVAEGLISPIFDKDTLEYTVTVPSDITSLSLDYEVEDKTSIVEVIGNNNLLNKINEVILKVTSKSGNTKEYKIVVTKDEESLYSNKLTKLTVNPGELTPEFDSNTNLYKVTVPNTVSEITVSVEREAKDSTVIGVGIHRLVTGRNVIPVQVTSKDGKIRIYTIIVYKEGSSDARLSNLEFNNGRLSPTFNKNTYKYTLIVPSDINLVTIKNIDTIDKDASYVIDGDVSKIIDGNIINIIVTSADKRETKTYEVDLKLEKSNNVYLKELSTNIGDLDPVFDKNTNKYKISVDDNVNSIYITALAESNNATVSGAGLKLLNSGTNYVNITVTSENGLTNVYTIGILKGKSSNNNLKNLLVRGYNIEPIFDKDTLEYNVTVPNEEISVVIDAEAEDVSSVVGGAGRVHISEGLNVANIVVTADDGSIKTYTINITREKIYSSKIKSLEIEEGVLSPVFNSDIYDYNITIPNEYISITPIIELEEKTATYEIIGNKDLKVGSNEISIKVTSENGKESIYTVNVVRSISSNNYLSSITTDKGTLIPNFNKETLNYTVTVDNTTEEITVNANAEISVSTVKGTGTYKLTTGENLVVLTVTSSSGIQRNYKVKVIREYDSNNYLSSLMISEGALVPAFDKTIEEYDVIVPDGTEKVEITGIKESITSLVTGLGTYDISVGTTNINIKVTAENGNLRMYKVNVIRNADNNTNLKTFVPSTGELDKEYSNDIDDYILKVDKNTNVVNFDIELEGIGEVSGNKDIIISEKETKVQIEVTAEDGSTRIINITIQKEESLKDIELEEDTIILVKGDTYQINPKLNPEGSQSEIIYEVLNDEIVSVSEDGVITGKKKGDTEVKIKSKEDENIFATLVVNVVLDKIESDIYDVVEKEEGKIIIGMDLGVTLQELKESILNDDNTLVIYDNEGNEITDYNEIVKTGQIIKLVINNREYDQATIVVRGDVDGDGYVNVSDYITVLNHALEVEDIVEYTKFAAADVEEDGIINVTDYIKIMDYSLENIDTLNK